MRYDIPELLKISDIFAHPSKREGLGIAPLEAMSCKCPVIMSNIPVLKEVYENSGLYIDPYNIENIKNMILKLINNDSLREELVDSGFKQSQKYSWEKSANKIINLIEDVSK